MECTASLVIYTDLDGTLLDHETYTWNAARPALSRLAALGVPVILASSKTEQEIGGLQIDLGLQAFPAIVENGAGLIFRGDKEGPNPSEYPKLRHALETLPHDLRACFSGFGDMSAEHVARVTGLSLSQAVHAKERQHSEPGLWSGTPDQRAAFLASLERHGIFAREGGRFLTLSFGKTKRDRMDDISARFQPDVTAALGDAPNDVEMLEHADFGFIISNPHRPALPELRGEREGRIFRAEMPGPEGWNTSINDLLDRLLLQKGARNIG